MIFQIVNAHRIPVTVHQISPKSNIKSNLLIDQIKN
nr:MAG TPA: hypothetical protein [Caudoviricetes sp.]